MAASCQIRSSAAITDLGGIPCASACFEPRGLHTHRGTKPAKCSIFIHCEQRLRPFSGVVPLDRATALLAVWGDGGAGGGRRQVAMDDVSVEASSGTRTHPRATQLRVSFLNRAIMSRVIGPGLPSPIVRLSTFTTGTTSAAVPVRKHSSAM
jgi:hypothetical protein